MVLQKAGAQPREKFEAREAELDAREAGLAEREAELAKRETELTIWGASSGERDGTPPAETSGDEELKQDEWTLPRDSLSGGVMARERKTGHGKHKCGREPLLAWSADTEMLRAQSNREITQELLMYNMEEAIVSLKQAQNDQDCTVRLGDVSESFAHALILLETSSEDECMAEAVKRAAKAYTIIAEWPASKVGKEGARAVRRLRDVVVLGVRLLVTPTCKGMVFRALEEAFELAEGAFAISPEVTNHPPTELTKKRRDVILLSWFKVARTHKLDTFQSTSQIVNGRRPRPRRARKRKEAMEGDSNRQLMAIVEGGDGEWLTGECTSDSDVSKEAQSPRDIPKSRSSPESEVVPRPVFVRDTETRLLVLSEMNSLLLWRDDRGKSPSTLAEIVTTEGGRQASVFLRPGAAALIVGLIREPRIVLAFVTDMEQCYCVPIAGWIMRRSFPDLVWTLERSGEALCWVSTVGRAYVCTKVSTNRRKIRRDVTDQDDLWKKLRKCGWNWCTAYNTMLLTTRRDDAPLPLTTVHVPGWRPRAEGMEDPNALDTVHLLGELGVAPTEESEERVPNTTSVASCYVTDVEEAEQSMRGLQEDAQESPCIAVGVECFLGQLCAVKLASARRGLVLDAIALGDEAMLPLLKPVLENDHVCIVYHSDEGALEWISWKYSIRLGQWAVDVAAHAQALDIGWTDDKPCLETLCQWYLAYHLEEGNEMAGWAPGLIPAEKLEGAITRVWVLLPLKTAIEEAARASSWEPWGCDLVSPSEAWVCPEAWRCQWNPHT